MRPIFPTQSLARRVFKGGEFETTYENRLLASAHGGLYNAYINRSVIHTSYDMANRMMQRQCIMEDYGSPSLDLD